MDVVETPIDKLVPYARNPRRNEEAVAAVAASLAEFGWRQPIVVDDDMVIVVGHTRYEAAKRLGMTSVPVHVAQATALIVGKAGLDKGGDDLRPGAAPEIRGPADGAILAPGGGFQKRLLGGGELVRHGTLLRGKERRRFRAPTTRSPAGRTRSGRRGAMSGYSACSPSLKAASVMRFRSSA